MFCVHCGVALPGAARFCNQCGKPVTGGPAGFKCPECGETTPSRESPCPKCGSRPVHCLECGQMISGSKFVCPGCKTLVGALPAYSIQPREYEHPAMQQMNQMLRQSASLNSMARTISQKVGKPWYESLFNSVLTSQHQYARVYELAYIAARRIGLKKMPSVYIEADRGYQSATYGSDQDSFVNIGTFLPRLLNDQELLFVLGHELGHLHSHHALWTTVSMFLVGQHRSTVMSDGILSYFSNPLKIVEQGMESAISSWMRVADLTADRAALLVVGDFEVAMRVLFLLYFKSRRELQDINLQEWVRQQSSAEGGKPKLSELGSPTPYLSSRLRELKSFYESSHFATLRQRVESGCGLDMKELFDEKGALRKKGDGAGSGKKEGGVLLKIPTAKGVACTCPRCRAKLTVQLRKAPENNLVKVSCPTCREVFRLNLAGVPGAGPQRDPARPAESRDAERTKAGVPSPSPVEGAHPDRAAQETVPSEKTRIVKGRCPKCQTAFRLPLEKLPGKPAVEIRCNGCKRTFRLILSRVRDDLSQMGTTETDPT